MCMYIHIWFWLSIWKHMCQQSSSNTRPNDFRGSGGSPLLKSLLGAGADSIFYDFRGSKEGSPPQILTRYRCWVYSYTLFQRKANINKEFCIKLYIYIYIYIYIWNVPIVTLCEVEITWGGRPSQGANHKNNVNLW